MRRALSRTSYDVRHGARCLRAFLRDDSSPEADAGGMLIARFLAQHVTYPED